MQVGRALVAAVGQAAAFQSVVLDVVDDLERAGGDQALGEEEQQALHAQRGEEPGRQPQPDRRPPQQFVAPGKRRMAELAQPLRLQRPGIEGVAQHRARQEMPDRLAEARAGRVFRRRYVHMVSAQMFDLETVVTDAGQQQAAEHGFEPAVLVDQFVRGVDRQHAADHALRQQPARGAERAEIRLHEPGAGPYQQGDLHRQGQQRQYPEPGRQRDLPFSLRRHIGRIVPERIVGRRQQHEQEEHRPPGQPFGRWKAREHPGRQRQLRRNGKDQQEGEGFQAMHGPIIAPCGMLQLRPVRCRP